MVTSRMTPPPSRGHKGSLYGFNENENDVMAFHNQKLSTLLKSYGKFLDSPLHLHH